MNHEEAWNFHDREKSQAEKNFSNFMDRGLSSHGQKSCKTQIYLTSKDVDVSQLSMDVVQTISHLHKVQEMQDVSAILTSTVVVQMVNRLHADLVK